MINDYTQIPAIAALATGVTGSELTFTFPEVLEAIKLCTSEQIAVLGVEVFKVRAGGYYTENLSVYDLKPELKRGPENKEGWVDYVRANNALAEDFISQNPAGDDHVYILTTSSWGEFCKIPEIR
jgi:hypothetical protein